MTAVDDREALRLARVAAAGLGLLVLAGCAGPGGNPDTADSAQCDHGFLCGSYVDGDGDGSVSQDEWDSGPSGRRTRTATGSSARASSRAPAAIGAAVVAAAAEIPPSGKRA